VRTCGLDPAPDARLSRAVGYLSQRFSLYGDLPVDENIAFFAEIHGVDGWQEPARRAARHAAHDAVPRAPRRRLSGGMKQKLALACTLVHTPSCWCSTSPRPASTRSRAATSGAPGAACSATA
jgi:ABC-2 type transport system ATP-binding protein